MTSKHIMIIVNSLSSGGAERVTSNLASNLVDKGYKVTVLLIQRNKKDFYSLDKRVDRIYFYDERITIFRKNISSAKYVDYLRLLLKPIYIPYLLFKEKLLLRSVLKKYKPDIVIGMITSNAVRAIVSSMGLPVKVIAAERNFPGRKRTILRWEKGRKLFYRFADAHVVQTQKISDWLANNVKASNIKIITNCVHYPIPETKPIIHPKQIIKKEDRIILAVGRLHEQKGFDLLIKAFKTICEKSKTHKLVILGEQKSTAGNYRGELENLISEMDLKDKVLLPGSVGNIGEWFERADIFVLSSRYEGFPNVLLEAMASGCACVSFDCDTGPGEIIEHGKNGLLVEPENPDALADAMLTQINDEELKTRIAKNAVEVRSRFSEDKILAKWIDLFEELSPSKAKTNEEELVV